MYNLRKFFAVVGPWQATGRTRFRPARYTGRPVLEVEERRRKGREDCGSPFDVPHPPAVTVWSDEYETRWRDALWADVAR